MADKEKGKGELRHVSLCRAENGWKISCSYESEKTLRQRAGWTPCDAGECKEYVEKSKAAVLKRLEEVL